MKIVIVDDNKSIALAIQQSLQAFTEFSSVKVYSSGMGFLRHISKTGSVVPDIVLMDISMKLPDEGIIATRQLVDQYSSIKVIMLTVADDDERIFESFKAGAVGYLLKSERIPFIYRTIIDVFNGGALMSPGVALRTIRFFNQKPMSNTVEEGNKFGLTIREQEILHYVAKGNTYQAVAEELFISSETVKKHLSNIFKKLQVKNRIEAINKVKATI